MSTGHVIIESILLSAAVIAAFYILHSIVYVLIMLKPEDEEQSELHSKVRYKQTEDLMNEINNSKNFNQMRKASYFTPSELELYNQFSPLFNDAQMKVINRKTPEAEVETKTDKNGFKYKSVKAAYVKALVTLVTGGNYDFEIMKEEFILSTREVKVTARMTIRSNGQTSFRDQIGQHHLNHIAAQENQTTISKPIDFGNGYKAAASDAFKKCASEFGFCWDIYGQEHSEKKKEEQPEPDHAEKKKLERLEHFLNESDSPEAIQHNYNIHLKTSPETEASKAILKKHMNRLGFTEA